MSEKRLSAESVARFLMEQIEAQGEYEQELAVSDCIAQFNRDALYESRLIYNSEESGNPRFGQSVLQALGKMKHGRVAWDKRSRAWSFVKPNERGT